MKVSRSMYSITKYPLVQPLISNYNLTKLALKILKIVLTWISRVSNGHAKQNHVVEQIMNGTMVSCLSAFPTYSKSTNEMLYRSLDWDKVFSITEHILKLVPGLILKSNNHISKIDSKIIIVIHSYPSMPVCFVVNVHACSKITRHY